MPDACPLVPSPGNSDEGVSIYEGWRGRGTLPAMLLRADVSRLQSLSSAKLPQYV